MSMFVVMTVLLDLRFLFFFFNDTATTEIYTLSLHDALPIFGHRRQGAGDEGALQRLGGGVDVRVLAHRLRQQGAGGGEDRKSTRLNSSHANISYAVFCLKKKKK